ncbi:MAG: PD-(D/E)XK nuclease family protein [Phormidesmis priestleyi]|uniref:PD-(D/E)XK nuclease family protein n=1 Tax=Phormidesmis priestleyi TaxID=268141 RepID=A0A2W5A0Y4_9CYAN|nr:MAG: PD-(D/E)XK nuclease family protein [Phormidesmis priestleyi]
MPRFISTYLYPQQSAAQQASDNSYRVITPSRQASRAIAARHQPLYDTATKALEQHGQVMAQPLQAQKLFRQTVQAVLQPADLIGTARALMPAVRSLLQSSSNLECDSDNLSTRATNLITLAQQYQAALHKDGCFDEGELYWRAAELNVDPQKTLIYGYFQPRQDELAWIDKLAADKSIVFLPICDTALFVEVQSSVDFLEKRGWSVTGDEITTHLAVGIELCQTFLQPAASVVEQPPINAEMISAYAYGTLDAESRGVLAQVKALLSADVPAREIAIIARDERAYAPKLIDTAWEYGLPLRALYSTPLLTTRLGNWIEQLLNVLDAGFPFEATAKLLSHPLCSNPDSGFWAVARSQHPEGFQQWRKIAKENLGLDLSALAQVNQTRRRDTWVDWWQRLLKTYDLRLRCARWARESIAFNALQKGLVELSKPEAETLAWAEFRQQLEDLLEKLSVPAQPGRGGVELHSPASVVGAQYSHVFVMGMAEGILPPSISNDSVLDFFERQQLRGLGVCLLSAIELFHQETLSFYYLLQTATHQITFSYSTLSDRSEQLPSAYLKRMGLQIGEPPEQPIASLEEMRRGYLRQPDKQAAEASDPVLTQAIRAFQVEERRESALSADEYDGIVGVPFDYRDWTFSVSQLTNLGQCPFKWFANKVLKLGSSAEADTELSPSLRGNLYHQVVELLVKAVQANPQLSLTDPDLLREKFLEAEREIDFPTLPAWEMRREDHLRTLLTVLRKPDFWPDGAEPVALERKFKGEWEGFKVTGRVDRIDKTPDGLVLIDYKTSSKLPRGLKDSNGKTSIDLQLQLYQDVAASEMFPGETVTAAQYFSLTKGKVLKLSDKAPQQELPMAIENCKTALNLGHYPVQPDVKRDACRYCDFDPVCRQGSRLTRKENHHGTD